MEVDRIKELMLLTFTSKNIHVVLVGGNHTAARSMKKQTMMKRCKGGNLELNSTTLLVIRFPDSWVLRVLSRSVFFSILILTLPWISSMMKGNSVPHFINAFKIDRGYDMINFEFIDALFEDLLSHEGLLKKGDKALLVKSGGGHSSTPLPFLYKNSMVDLNVESDLENLSLILDGTFDLVLLLGSLDTELVDRVLKVGGMVAIQLSNDALKEFGRLSTYKIIYLRKYKSTVVLMRKVAATKELGLSSTRRKLYSLGTEMKKTALKGLEDVLLEPPRKALVRSREYLNKIKFLPELLGDSLERYEHRVFVTVGSQKDNGEGVEWFNRNYPRNNLHFDVYKLDSPAKDIDVLEWLMKNVKEEEYVVMKAEADVAEKLLEKRRTDLVDEMFLECNSQWNNRKTKTTKRAYWECLSLYGRLRDEGVAVHQWWS